MNLRYFALLYFFCFAFFSYGQKKSPIFNDYTQFTDNFWGVEGGNIFPGVCLPFSLIRLGADTKLPASATTGYHSEKPIVGFSHTHLSGTGGGGRYGNILVTPQVGELTVANKESVKRSNEFAKPGYYAITLQRMQGDVKAELTATERCALHQYEFYTWDKKTTFDAQILIDVAHTVTRTPDKDCTDGEVRIVNTTEIEGYGAYKGGWGGENPYTVYFVAQFDTPFSSAGTFTDTIFAENTAAKGQKIGAYARFKATQHQKVKVKVAISFLSVAQARKNLTQIPHWDFYAVRMRADSVWNSYLSKIKVQGGTPEQKLMLYSGLYHTLIMPTDITGENPKWQTTAPTYWEHYCLWDVSRCLMPLHTLIYPQRQRAIINSLLDVYDKRGWLPDGWTAGDYAFIQGGTHADVVVADAVVKNLGGFDKEKAYQAIKKNADITSDNPYLYGRELTQYLKYGYVPYGVKRCVSRTLEYAYNDFCVAQVAKNMGKTEDYQQYLSRSKNSLKLFDKTTGFFLAKDTNGNTVEQSLPQYPQLPNPYSDAPFFYEGNAWIYANYYPQDLQGLINAHGGNEKYVQFLDKVFDEKHFEIGNEPGFLTPYLYHYALRPDKTAERVRHIIENEFVPGRKGLPGQDDSGALSSWFVWGSVGLYPVAGQNIYLIGSPVFTVSEISLENNKKLRIIAPKTSPANKYVIGAKWNGKKIQTSWLTHEQLQKGGELVLEMSDKPTNWGQTTPPPSY
jgi:predicted alpha-1,2-mannosidase